MVLHNFSIFRIWNTDETGIPIVLPHPKVVATKGLKQVQQTFSHERGVNTTVLAFISAGGMHIPPVFIFPRKRFVYDTSRPCWMHRPCSSFGFVNADTFLESLKHFVTCKGCNKQAPHLLLLDNHSSHPDLKVINFARDNGIVMLTFPPHCSHKLQPIDLSVYGPFKGALRTAFNDWQDLNSGGQILIHLIAELSRKPYECSFSTANIISSFSKSGLFPFNRDIFSDEDFLPSPTTDRPQGIVCFISYKSSSLYILFLFLFLLKFPPAPSLQHRSPRTLLQLRLAPSLQHRSPRTWLQLRLTRRFNISRRGPCYNYCQCRCFKNGRKSKHFCVTKGRHI